jgi:hypothetical protein
VGREYSACSKCDSEFRSVRREWVNLRPGQKAEFFISTWVIALVICAALLGFAFNQSITGVAWGLVWALALCIPAWAFKLCRFASR